MSFSFFIFFLIVITLSENIDDTLNNKRNLQTEANEYSNIRIYIDDKCLVTSQTSTESQNNTDLSIIRKSIQNAKNALEKLIKVKRIDKLDLGNNFIPNEFKDCANIISGRIDYDLAIFIRWKIQGVESIAYPKASILRHINNNQNNRPLIGMIIYDFQRLYNFDGISEDKEQLLSTLFLHEFTHILGFNKTIFYAKNLILTDTINRIKPTQKLFFQGGKTKEMAKKYFNCNNISGIQLDEEIGDEPEDTIHWSGRILFGDYMTADLYYSEQAISEITLASLEDLGWYEVNYYTGGLMRFGKNKGCNFFDQDCIEAEGSSLKSKFQNEFCSSLYDDSNVFGTCSSGRQSMGLCFNLFINSQIDREYYRTNFKSQAFGFGNFEINEYCPYTSSDVKIQNPEYNYKGNCKFGNGRYNEINRHFEESYSETSFCAFSSLLNNKSASYKNSTVKGLVRPTCYKMSCSEKSLTIHIGSEFIVCPKNGGIIKVDNSYSYYKGLLICPDYNLICTGTFLCNNLFDCVEKRSTVKDSAFVYSEPVNVNVSIEITNNTENSINNQDIITDGLYELGEKGVCPKDCQQCTPNKQCAICRPDYIHYIGTKEDDDKEIKCSLFPPAEGYYHREKNGKNYYYKCIDNCITCNNANECLQCNRTYFVNSTNKQCQERIPGCTKYDETKPVIMQDNGGNYSYLECLNCNGTANYYCMNENKSICNYIPNINMSIYAFSPWLDYLCYKRCEDRYSFCVTCNSTKCVVCNETKRFINENGNCVKEIEHCERHNLYNDTPECLHCHEDQNYYCIDTDRSQCQLISETALISYYKKDNTPNSCVKLCNETYNDTCLKCNNTGCTKCKEGYFIYEGQCKKNMTGCIDNIVINPNPLTLECNNCDSNASYYCINEDRSKCNLMEASNISMHYLLPDLNYSCYGLCGDIIEHCIECNSTNCFKCTEGYDVNRRKQYCLVPPMAFKEDVPCQVILKEDNNILNSNFDFNSTMINYFLNLGHINKVEHFVGNNYTVTLFINSNCTEGLLSEGYFKINNRELNRSFIEEGDIEYVYHTFAIYINYNYRSYLRFYDIEQNYLDPANDIDCKTCLEKNYYVTHNLYNILQDIIGTQFTELAIEKNLDIFSEESPIYTDSCENLTLYAIDVPINLRKKLLFFHEHFEPLMCRDVDCKLVEYNLTNKTSICECKIGNTFEDLLNSPKFEFNPYNTDTDPKGFSETVKVVKCLTKGIKYSSFKINTAAIICVVIFVLQCLLYFANNCYGQPYSDDIPAANSTLANPPKSDSPTRIYLYSDWDLSNIQKGKEPIEEEEKVIQPRDDSGDQIMEEEKSLNNDIFSNVSIDTNAGGLFNDKKTNRSLRAAEKNKKVLILLGNNLKTKKKVSIEQSVNGKMSSENEESDETPLGKRRKYDNSGFCRNYWIYLSVKQHIINFFGVITFCNMTKNYIPLTIKIIRSLFLVVLSLILSILWLDQKYIQKKWEHFNDKYSLLTTEEKNISIPLSERISYALSHTIVHVIVDLIVLIFADFIIGVAFFKIREEGDEIIELNEELRKKVYENYINSKEHKLYRKKVNILYEKTKNKNNIFFSIVFILVVVFFISLCGFGATYPGGVVDCVTSGIFAIILLEIIPFIWSLILALFRYLGNKKKNECMKSFSEFFLY